MVWFWELRGRSQGGVFIIYAPPSEGKTYISTAIALELMKDGVTVFSNWPIVSVDGKYCSKVWEGKEKMQKQNLRKCAIFLDEAYKEGISSRNWDEFSEEDHDWFATSGHEEMIIYIIVQHFSRIEKIVREIINLIYFVHKVRIPLIDLPLWFTVDAFEDVDHLTQYLYGRADPYKTERFRFKVDVALAYNTMFCAKHGVNEPVYEGISWIEYYLQKNPPIVYKYPEFNLVQVLKYKYYTRIKDFICLSLVPKLLRLVGKVRGLIGSLQNALKTRIKRP